MYTTKDADLINDASVIVRRRRRRPWWAFLPPSPIHHRPPSDLAENVCSMIRHKCKPGVVLKTSISVDRRLFFLGDTLRLQQILLNLLTNALKHTHKGTVELSISSRSSSSSGAGFDRGGAQGQECVVFRVKDTGVGMCKEDVDVLWARFKQRGKGMGTSGLGMNITHKLILLMKATNIVVDTVCLSVCLSVCRSAS